MGHLATDKKHAAGRLRWVLPTADGVVVRDDVDPAVVERAAAAAPGRRRAGRAMTAVLVLQGPNLNLLGTREPEIYGYETLDEIHAGIAARAAELGLEVDFFQSNHEGALIDRLHRRDFDIAIVNAGGLTHTSVALRDALLAIQRPFIEVHLSDPSTREPFRQVNFLHDIALESIVGQGARGYHLALEAIARRSEAAVADGRRREPETPELRRLRRRIDALDRRLVALLNERAELAREAGRAKAAAGRRAIRDADREREVLLRVTMANAGPAAAGRPARALPPADGGHAGARGARSPADAAAGGTGDGRDDGGTAPRPGPGRRSGDPDPLRPGPDRLPPPRPRRERRLRVGTRRGRRR